MEAFDVPLIQKRVWKDSKLSSVVYVTLPILPLIYQRDVLISFMFMIGSVTKAVQKKYRSGCSLFMGSGYNYAIHKNRPNNFACVPEINSFITGFQIFISFHLKVIKSVY